MQDGTACAHHQQRDAAFQDRLDQLIDRQDRPAWLCVVANAHAVCLAVASTGAKCRERAVDGWMDGWMQTGVQ